ncbi:MAG: D-tyrosyl-tRNA(Tyr) deacylase [Planctomycetia bacterium]|nr:D-tyrosyl-tRNA(Tyr) deacylase [Planctomycetia bacterium]
MRAVIQRVSRASVTIDGQVVGAIGPGLLVLLGVAPDDSLRQARWLADKVVHLRIFADTAGKMNRSVQEIAGGMLIVSQFTLYGDVSRGRRPSFVNAAGPPVAGPLVEAFVSAVRELGVEPATGRFGADMAVELINDGPVTLVVDTPEESPTPVPGK